MRRTTRPGVRRWLTAAALAAATILTVTSCGSPDGGKDDQARELLPPSVVDTSDGLRIDDELVADKQLYDAAKNDTVILYSGTGKEAEDLTAARFMQETGIKIELTRLPTNKLAERALSEHGAGQLPAEIIRITDPRVAREFEKQNVFVPYQTPFHNLLVQQNTGVRDTFVNCYYFVNAMGYNSAMIEDDQHQVGGPDRSALFRQARRRVGDHRRHLERPRALPDRDPWRGLPEGAGAQNPRIFDSTSTEVDALARGEIAIGSLSFNNAFAAQLAGARSSWSSRTRVSPDRRT